MVNRAVAWGSRENGHEFEDVLWKLGVGADLPEWIKEYRHKSRPTESKQTLSLGHLGGGVEVRSSGASPSAASSSGRCPRAVAFVSRARLAQCARERPRLVDNMSEVSPPGWSRGAC